MKIISMIIILLSLSCGGDKKGGANHTSKSGGVDVGNLTYLEIPGTEAYIAETKNWTVSSRKKEIRLSSPNGSRITAKEMRFDNVTSLNKKSLKLHLDEKYKNQDLKEVQINGLRGYQFSEKAEKEHRFELYLLTEMDDLINVAAQLKEVDLLAGKEIVNSTRILYKGQAFPSIEKKTVNLIAYDHNLEGHLKGAYSFSKDCFPYVSKKICNGVAVIFANAGGREMRVGAAGYDWGRIIELGHESDVPFEEIKIKGKYLVSPKARVNIADIYTVFTPKSLKANQSEVNLKEGHVYLIRTISWPNEDIITKVRVDRLQEDRSVQLTYSKLAFVPEKELKKKVNRIKKNTLKYDKPRASGEIHLFNRMKWKSYFYAAFNFEYSTSRDMYSIRNDYDVLYSADDDNPELFVISSSSGFGDIREIGGKEIDDIKPEDFPSLDDVKNESMVIEREKTYLISSFKIDGKVIRGVLKVLDFAPDYGWVKLKYKRISIGGHSTTPDWIKLDFPKEVLKVALKTSSNQMSEYYPFILRRGDEGYHDEELEYYSYSGKDYLTVNILTYFTNRGFVELDSAREIKSFTPDDFKGEPKDTIELREGAQYGLIIENYFNRTQMVIRVDQLDKGKQVKLSFRYLDRSKTKFSSQSNDSIEKEVSNRFVKIKELKTCNKIEFINTNNNLWSTESVGGSYAVKGGLHGNLESLLENQLRVRVNYDEDLTNLVMHGKDIVPYSIKETQGFSKRTMSLQSSDGKMIGRFVGLTRTFPNTDEKFDVLYGGFFFYSSLSKVGIETPCEYTKGNFLDEMSDGKCLWIDSQTLRNNKPFCVD